MIGEVNAVTGIYIRAMGVHSWNTGIAAVWSAEIFERAEWSRSSEKQDAMANVFNHVAVLACKPWLHCVPNSASQLWQV